jgi:hypothetical protein
MNGLLQFGLPAENHEAQVKNSRTPSYMSPECVPKAHMEQVKIILNVRLRKMLNAGGTLSHIEVSMYSIHAKTVAIGNFLKILFDSSQKTQHS